MKSFNQILERMKDLFKSGGVPSHSVGGSKHSNKNRKANPWRRAHKPLYGGMAHRLDPIGQTPAFTIEFIRDVETILGIRCILMPGNNLLAKQDDNTSIYLGGPNQSMLEVVQAYMKARGQSLTLYFHEKDIFRQSRARRHGIPFELLNAADEPLREYQDHLDYETWHNENYDALSEEFSESGAAGELDSDLESFIEDRYEATLRGMT